MGNYLHEISKHSLQFKKKKDINGGCKVKDCIAPLVSDGFCLEHRAVYRLQEERAAKKIARRIERDKIKMESVQPRSSAWIRFVNGGSPQ